MGISYLIKFLCDDNIHTVKVDIPSSICQKLDTDKLDEMISMTINAEKEYKKLTDLPHTIIEMKKSNNQKDWIEMI